MAPYTGSDGATITTLRDSIFSTVPGSPAYVAKASYNRVNLPEFGMVWYFEGRNAIQSEYRIPRERDPVGRLDGVAALEGPHHPELRQVHPVVRGLRHVRRRSGNRGEDRVPKGRDRRAVGPRVGSHLRGHHVADPERPGAAADLVIDRRPAHAEHLSDQASQVGEGATQLSGVRVHQGLELLVGGPLVHEDDDLPRPRGEDVSGDVVHVVDCYHDPAAP